MLWVDSRVAATADPASPEVVVVVANGQVAAAALTAAVLAERGRNELARLAAPAAVVGIGKRIDTPKPRADCLPDARALDALPVHARRARAAALPALAAVANVGLQIDAVAAAH
jgi:hypothetical protein